MTELSLFDQAPPKRLPKQSLGILHVLARLPEDAVLSRDEIVARYGAGLLVASACARLNELEKANYVRAVEDAAVSHFGRKVAGYCLTDAGRVCLMERACG